MTDKHEALRRDLALLKKYPWDDSVIKRALDAVPTLIIERDGYLAQHHRDSQELRSLCAARDEARRERDALQKALHGIVCAFPTDTDMAAAEWSESDIKAACNAYDAARAALSQ